MKTSLGGRIKGVGALILVSSVAVSSAIMASPASAAVTTAMYNTPGSVMWRVPTGVHSIVVEASGASGGTAWSGQVGGLGGQTRATLLVIPGEDLQINVGGAGGDGRPGDFGGNAAGGVNGGGLGADADAISYSQIGFGGGGGGGASDVRRAPFGLAQRLVVGAGGGGGSLTCIGGAGGGVFGGASPNCPPTGAAGPPWTLRVGSAARKRTSCVVIWALVATLDAVATGHTAEPFRGSARELAVAAVARAGLVEAAAGVACTYRTPVSAASVVAPVAVAAATPT